MKMEKTLQRRLPDDSNIWTAGGRGGDSPFITTSVHLTKTNMWSVWRSQAWWSWAEEGMPRPDSEVAFEQLNASAADGSGGDATA